MINFVGYGSLLSHASLRATIKDKPFTPVIVRGYKRIFNIAEDNGKDPDILNLIKNKKAKFNGALFTLTEKELTKISERETGYNIEETKVFDFTTNKPLGKAFLVIDYYVAIDKIHRLPDKEYFIMCREAAYSISKNFGKTWDETTFTATGKRISEWIKKHPEYTLKKH